MHMLQPIMLQGGQELNAKTQRRRERKEKRFYDALRFRLYAGRIRL